MSTVSEIFVKLSVSPLGSPPVGAVLIVKAVLLLMAVMYAETVPETEPAAVVTFSPSISPAVLGTFSVVEAPVDTEVTAVKMVVPPAVPPTTPDPSVSPVVPPNPALMLSLITPLNVASPMSERPPIVSVTGFDWLALVTPLTIVRPCVSAYPMKFQLWLPLSAMLTALLATVDPMVVAPALYPNRRPPLPMLSVWFPPVAARVTGFPAKVSSWIDGETVSAMVSAC